MPAASLAFLRLCSQQLVFSRCRTAAQVVTVLGAMQAQDYGGAIWAMGCRIPDSKEADIEQAIRDRTIVRTWPMRGTLHFVPADDVRWMLALLTPRVIASTATRVKQLELDEPTFAKAERVLVKALRGGKHLTREDTLVALAQANISTTGGRGYHILFRLSMRGLLCCGPREGKQQTFVLLDEWLPKSKSLDREESLAVLARRYFGGHGPATLPDFVWWSGLKVAEAKAALASVASEFECHRVDGVELWQAPGLTATKTDGVHLLPGFDEYLLGYKDRSAVLDEAHANKVVPGGNGMFLRTIVTNGRVTGTWKQSAKAAATIIAPASFARLKKTESSALAIAAERYGHFLGTPIIVANGT